MALNRLSIPEREYHKFVESPTRSGEPAVEVVGQLSVAPTSFNGSEDIKNLFNEISSVPSSTETTIISYTVPALKKFGLQRIQTSGTNIATYNVYLDGNKISVVRTMFGSNLNADIVFSTESGLGFLLNAGQNLVVKVEHSRPYTGNFEARILGVEANV